MSFDSRTVCIALLVLIALAAIWQPEIFGFNEKTEQTFYALMAALKADKSKR
ncbi:hypothetical protein [Comamonas sp. lk]|uniref:hypothetical protein n=1 Tax=Comamonas sp. lk TaxID=2201272 RepID=UPI0013CE657D|nr:hypothetical protein [Comamonas sp. lk]